MRAAPDFQLTAYDPAEHEMQEECTRALNTILLPTVCWTAIDAGHSFDQRIGRHGVPRGMLEAQKRKRRGVKKGWPDYQFFHHGSAFAIELKVPSGTLSPEQKDILRQLIANQVSCRVCWSVDLVIATVAEWGLSRPLRIAA